MFAHTFCARMSSLAILGLEDMMLQVIEYKKVWLDSRKIAGLTHAWARAWIYHVFADKNATFEPKRH